MENLTKEIMEEVKERIRIDFNTLRTLSGVYEDMPTSSLESIVSKVITVRKKDNNVDSILEEVENMWIDSKVFLGRLRVSIAESVLEDSYDTKKEIFCHIISVEKFLDKILTDNGRD